MFSRVATGAVLLCHVPSSPSAFSPVACRSAAASPGAAALVTPDCLTPGAAAALVTPDCLTPGAAVALVTPDCLTPGAAAALVTPDCLTPGAAVALVTPDCLTPGAAAALGHTDSNATVSKAADNTSTTLHSGAWLQNAWYHHMCFSL